MMRDVIRFNKEAPELLRLDPTDPQRTQTMGQYCDANEYRYVCPVIRVLQHGEI